MDISICKALPEDAYDYTACHIACWRDAYTGIIPDEHFEKMSSETELRAERIRKILKEPGDSEFYYAAHEGHMVGRLIIGKSMDEDKIGVGMIGALYLRKDFWGTGNGGKLMDFAKEALKRLGYTEINLWVLEENLRARRFYEKSGFVTDGARKVVELGRPLVEVRYAFLY